MVVPDEIHYGVHLRVEKVSCVWIASAPVSAKAPRVRTAETRVLRLRKYAAARMKTNVATSHQLGGRQACLPIQSPTANASAAQSRGSRLEAWIVDVEPGRTRLLKRVKCPAIHDVWAIAVVDSPVGKGNSSSPDLKGQAKYAFNVKSLREKID